MQNNILNLLQYLRQNSPNLEIIEASNPAIEKYINLERGESATPTAAFKPKSEEEIEQLIKALNKFQISAVIFAGNTGLVSAQRAQKQAVIDLSKLDSLISIELQNGHKINFQSEPTSPAKKLEAYLGQLISEIEAQNLSNEDFENCIIHCQAAMPIGSINYILERVGQIVPIDMGSITIAGGMTAGAGVANASHGTFGLLYGKMSDLCLEAKAINGNGTWRLDENLNAGKSPIIDEERALLNSAIPQYGDSSFGTQGTFSLITALKLVTKPISKQQFYFLVKLNDLKNISNIRKHLTEKYNVLQFEIMNQFATDLVRKFEPSGFTNPFYSENGVPLDSMQQIDSKYLLMIQIIEFTEENLAFKIFDELIELDIKESHIAFAGAGGAEPEGFISLRHSISGASTKYANSIGNSVKNRITPDLSVPIKNIEKFVSEIEFFCSKNKLKLCLFGHIGVGSFHVHVFFDDSQKILSLPAGGVRGGCLGDDTLNNEGESSLRGKRSNPEENTMSSPELSSNSRAIKKNNKTGSPRILFENSGNDILASIKTQITEQLYKITTSLNGSCWSEHGIGTANAELYQKYTPAQQIEKWKAFKEKHDPNNILNSYSNGFLNLN